MHNNGLKTITPFGINERREMPPPILFALQFRDQAANLNILIKTFYENSGYRDLALSSDINLCLHTKEQKSELLISAS